MKKIRLFYDKDAEQDWLNRLSLQGWALDNYFLGVYTFVPCEPGEYIYQIDLLDNWSGDKKDFAAFMEDSGVEVVDQWYRWVFLRKKAADGPFEMYTDAESKISQYNRVINFFRIALIVEVICFFIEINAAIHTGNALLWFFTILLGLIVLAILRIVWKCKWKIEELNRERG